LAQIVKVLNLFKVYTSLVTCSISECRRQASVTPVQKIHLPNVLHAMSQPNINLSIQSEGRIAIATQALEIGQFQSVRSAATASEVCPKKLERRLKGIHPQCNCKPNSKKLTKLEESVIIEHILNLDSCGFALKYNAVRDMANNLLAEHSDSKVGIKWPENFVQRTPELKAHFNRKYDYQRAKCKDPEIIGSWFQLVQNTKAKYRIQDKDTYNFDKTGFQIGIISTGIVITGSEQYNRPKAIQPGNWE
jgi:hypothetical protein